jgi:hypothetical protein
MAAESGYLSILANPVEALAAAGGGNLLKGIGLMANLGKSLKNKVIHNMLMVSGTDTVGADTLVNVKFHIYQPALLIGMHYSDSAQAVTFTGLKCNGELIAPRGASADNAANITMQQLIVSDEMDWFILIGADTDLEFTGTATNADVVNVTLVMWDLDFARIS